MVPKIREFIDFAHVSGKNISVYSDQIDASLPTAEVIDLWQRKLQKDMSAVDSSSQDEVTPQVFEVMEEESDASASSSAPLEVEQRGADVTENAITPRELNAEIRAVEECMDRRHAELSGKIDLLTQTIGNAIDKVTTEIGHTNWQIASTQRDLEGNLPKLSGQIADLTNKSSKDKRQIISNIWAIAIGTFIAGVVEIWTTNGLIMSAIQTALAVLQGAKH